LIAGFGHLVALASLGAGLLLAAASPLQGQSAPGLELVDRVVAIAGDSVILLSQVEEQLVPALAQDPALQNDSARIDGLRRTVIENLIDQQLVVQAALRDTTIVVDEDRVEATIDEDIARRTESFGGEEALLAGLSQQGWSLGQYRELLRQDARRQQLQAQYMAKLQRGMKPIPVTEAEIQAFYDTNRDQVGSRPATVTFRQVVLTPSPSDSADAVALAEARRILDLALAGEDFADLAERYSGDEGSAAMGGDLGWFKRPSGFVREFEEAAFAIGSGQITNPIRTQYGYHVIKVERVRGPERKASHILVSFDIGEGDLERARRVAADIKERVENGESAKALHAEFGAEELPDSLAVAMDRLSELPPGYAQVLRTASAGDVFGPIEFGEGARATLAVIEVADVRDEGTFTYDDLEPVIRDRLQREKILEELMRRLRQDAYVDVRY